MNLQKHIFVYAILAFSLEPLEAAWNPSCTSFVYINGVNTKDIDAAGTVTNYLVPQFRDYLASKGKSASCYSIHLSYNRHTWFVSDFENAYSQYVQQGQTVSTYEYYDELINAAPSDVQSSYISAQATTSLSLVNSTFETLQKPDPVTTASVIARLQQTEMDSLSNLVNVLLSAINNNNTAVCVGYSQGNFFCNLAYRVIQQSDSDVFAALNISEPSIKSLNLTLPNPRVLQVIGIADPANFTADDRNQYVTHCADAITVVPNSLPSNIGDGLFTCIVPIGQLFNIGNAVSIFDYLMNYVSWKLDNHSIETYLTVGNERQQRIMQMMEKSLIDSSSMPATGTSPPQNLRISDQANTITQAPPLTGTCSVNGLLNAVNLQTGSTAHFGAGSTGGTGTIHYAWTGITAGDVNNASQVYNSAGLYSVSVRIYDSASLPQQVNAACPQVTVVNPVQPLSVSCGFYPNSILIGGSTNMVVGGLNGFPPYTYQLPGDSGFSTNATKTFTVNSTGSFSYTASAKDSQGNVASSTCSFMATAASGDLTITSAIATPNPVKKNTNLLVQLRGSNFQNGTTHVSLLGPGCSLYNSCPMPVNVVSSVYIESRLTIANPGNYYTVWLSNDSANWILAPVLVINVTN